MYSDFSGKASTLDYRLDITSFVCPMTYVRAKLLLERMKVGETCRIRLKGEEPLRNVPRALREDGHDVLDLSPESGEGGVHVLTVRKGR